MDSIEQRVKKIVAEQLGVNEADIKNESAFVDDLGADRSIRWSWSWRWKTSSSAKSRMRKPKRFAPSSRRSITSTHT